MKNDIGKINEDINLKKFDDPYKRLAAAIIKQAYEDANSRCWGAKSKLQFYIKQDAIHFLQTRWFNEICEYLNLNPDYIRRKIHGGKKKTKIKYAMPVLWD